MVISINAIQYRMAVVEMSRESSLDIDTPHDLWLAEQHANYFDLHPVGSADH